MLHSLEKREEERKKERLFLEVIFAFLLLLAKLEQTDGCPGNKQSIDFERKKEKRSRVSFNVFFFFQNVCFDTFATG